MSIKYKIVALVFLTVGSFAIGRWVAPEKIRIETHTVEIEKKTEETKSDTSVDRHKETTVVEVSHPDGTKEKKTTTVEDSSANRKHDTKTEDDKETDSSSVKVVEHSSSKITISALAAINPFSLGPAIYGAHVSKAILGPVTIGFFGFSDGRMGASAGLTF